MINLKQHIYEKNNSTTAQLVEIFQLFYTNNNSVRAVYSHLLEAQEDYGKLIAILEKNLQRSAKI